MPPASGLVVDLLGFITGTVLYVMLIFMVWREAAHAGAPMFSARGRLPLLTGICGLVWNLGALASFGARLAGSESDVAVVPVLAFGALGFLPAVVVHSLLYGRETAAGSLLIKRATLAAYVLSATAALLQFVAAFRHHPVPSPVGLWVLTIGFIALTTSLLFLTRRQQFWRRGIWVAALAIFAVSALHFSRHVGNESWWVELATHHASLPLALAILIQDYRFGFADLFLKNALALLGLMVVSVALFSAAILPLMRWQGSAAPWDPRAVAAFVALWIGTALMFPLLRRAAAWVVDRAVFRRPDYGRALGDLARQLDSAADEPAIIAWLAAAVSESIAAQDAAVVDDPTASGEGRLVLTAADLKSGATGCALMLRLQTVEAPHRAITIAALPAGRRLLSDDIRWLEAATGLAARRIDALRVSRERLDRDVREEAMQRLATEAELRALRAQLNPHFLFNALTTIGYLIDAAPARALDTLLRLTNVLRSVLRRTTVDFSTLADELQFVESYLEIERARFEDRLQVTIDVPGDTHDLLVPTLLLQPLVENAIKHGIAPQRRGGRVSVSARLDGRSLRLAVEDTGIGFDAAGATRSSGLGLRSVTERLRVHYGMTASITIESRPGAGTRVQVMLPATPASRTAKGDNVIPLRRRSR